MNEPRNAPHSYYPSDTWTVADDKAARARDAEWEANDPNMVALAELGPRVKAAGETFAEDWASAR